jgi:hypothetical protein
MQNTSANISQFEGIQTTANATMGYGDLGVFNDQPPAAQRRSFGQRANDWMGRNLGLAFPSGQEIGDAYDKSEVGAIAKDISSGAYAGSKEGEKIGRRVAGEEVGKIGERIAGDIGQKIGKKAGGIVGSVIGYPLGGIGGAVFKPLGGFVDRHKPNAPEDIPD